MIQYRFRKHISEQNWFAVSIDLLVVIVGIFLGMQVTEWNEERKAQLEENIYIEKLLIDMDHSLPLQRKEIQIASEQLENIKWIIHTVEKGQLLDANKEKFELALTTANVTRAPRLVQRTMNELVTANLLVRFSNKAIKAQIAEVQENYIRSIETLKRVDTRFSSYKVDYDQYMLKRSYNPENKA
ncbi:MAG: hypothetical protein AB3N28_09670, partial [Kordiimonas sp.]